MGIFKGTSELKSIKIGIPHDDYSAMQGPAPSGFHVPLNTEWQAVYNIWTALGGGSSDGTNFGIALKMPFAGTRRNSNSNVYNQGSYGNYWSSSRYSENTAYYLHFRSTTLSLQDNGGRAHGYSVRCFKNSPTVPTSSWTKLYGTSIESGGIFWSSADGLISLSSDGTTWITIADKNLGATTVWNSGDTLSEANCGKYYQRGNNYGFPRTGSVTTSSTLVDASNYGPGNYYSSSTFITRSASPYRWDSTDNGNLRGGVTGIVHKTDTDIKKVYLGTNQIRPRPINFATQGPCPDGFHVPLSSEWDNVKTIWTSLGGGGSDGTNFGANLKLPMMGCRNYGDTSVSVVGSEGRYWSSSPNGTETAYSLRFYSSLINSYGNYRRSVGFPIRCFKNSSVTPTSSWTKLYGTSIDAGGIFWNSTDGLISLSSNGTTWMTMQDKNLGATTVWNSGDTLTDANCGNVFQWGNNYAFPGTKSSTSITTSPTKVNVTGYGPLNYYSSSTWITATPRQSSASNGNNLRGGEDGNVPV